MANYFDAIAGTLLSQMRKAGYAPTADEIAVNLRARRLAAARLMAWDASQRLAGCVRPATALYSAICDEQDRVAGGAR